MNEEEAYLAKEEIIETAGKVIESGFYTFDDIIEDLTERLDN